MRAKKIQELVKIVEESNIGELEITKWWGRKIRISKSSSPSHASSHIMVQAPHATEQQAQKPAEVAPVAKPEEAPKNNYVEIKSPMVGTFYRAPAPDAEPYVKEGDKISPGKVMCIIEAMKLMNEIEAEVNGKIVKIVAENAQPVEFNQTLFLVEPA